MSSNKRKDEIQKSVEESILEAVTKFKTDLSSFNPHDSSDPLIDSEKQPEDAEAPSIWNEVNQPASSDVENQGAQQFGNLAFDSKIFGESNHSHAAEGRAPNPPIFRKSDQVLKDEGKDDSQDHTLATKAIRAKGAVKAPPFAESADTFEFGAKNLANLNSIQLKLYEGDHLRIAQQRIEDLEREVDRLRLENERLASASELFQKRAEENLALKQELEKKIDFNEERFAEERISLKNHLETRDTTIKELREKVEDLEARLSNDIRKSRSRERELENRLELARLEKISLVGSKDEIILDLKRQVDQLNHELGSYRRKAAEMNQTIEANQEQFRRTVRALRLALTNLEVNEQIGGRSKKAE